MRPHEHTHFQKCLWVVMRSEPHWFLHDSPTSRPVVLDYVVLTLFLFFNSSSRIQILFLKFFQRTTFGFFQFLILFPCKFFQMYSNSPHSSIPFSPPDMIPLNSRFLLASSVFLVLLIWFPFPHSPEIFWPSVCKPRWAWWSSERFWEPFQIILCGCVCLCVCARMHLICGCWEKRPTFSVNLWRLGVSTIMVYHKRRQLYPNPTCSLKFHLRKWSWVLDACSRQITHNNKNEYI